MAKHHFAILLLFAGAACGPAGEETAATAQSKPPAGDAATDDVRCSSGGLTLPDGFCASIFTDSLGPVRHIATTGDGTLYAILRDTVEGHGLVAARDTDSDGSADEIERFGDITGTGLLVHGNWLYGSSNTAVYRWPLPEDGLAPTGEPELVVAGFPEQHSHAAKSIAIGEGRLFVNVGAPSNACMEEDRTPGSPGMDPCPLLETTGGIWAFEADEPGQEYAPDRRYATGIRNSVALAWNPRGGELYSVQHGRDQLHDLFPELYSTGDNAELPAEEMFRVGEGDDFGWPYCYYDHLRGNKAQAPEYGGDGSEVGRCAGAEDPVVTFPAHWGPNGLLFYTGDAFPEHYRGGAFVAFHGSWNRAPEPQAGYNVTFVPFDNGEAVVSYEPFADGFTGSEEIRSPDEAEYRPMGLAVDAQGALYISDSQKGRVWRVSYDGGT